jgi:hypothetical protein
MAKLIRRGTEILGVLKVLARGRRCIPDLYRGVIPKCNTSTFAAKRKTEVFMLAYAKLNWSVETLRVCVFFPLATSQIII